ncbi:2OG-Fe(II) oxygenase [Egbenema bharatensis]|uniref:2OG-Fe(II) oxygenase n=1 Tax=Egbenema bharatensis TaxID=3463334 RepID=UPI003A87FE9C
MANSQALPKNRHQYAERIYQRLLTVKDQLSQEFHLPDRINCCYVDNLLDESDARAIYAAFPAKAEMLLLKDLREYKHVTMQMNQVNPILEEIIYAFQDPKVVAIVSEITGLQALLPDEYLYAGGISLMDEGCYLNPHLDNSHNKDRTLYRALNLLYYVTPDWQEWYGGNLELWDQGLQHTCRTIHSRFNRLVIMITNRSSWHSVSPIQYQGQRCCINNYYFSSIPPDAQHYSHVTSFRGRPNERFNDLVLQADTFLRNRVPRSFKNFIRKPQYYKK